MAWEQTLAWSLMAIIGLWGAGTAVVCPQPHADSSVAEQAMPWWSILPYRITN
jgi:type VI secretion system protein ImpL